MPKPNDHIVIGTSWIFRNKLDEYGVIVRNKSRLVGKGYKTYASFARLKVIRILLAYAFQEILNYIKWISKVPFLMDTLWKRYMFNNL